MHGIHIALDGPNGAGKTTHFNRLLADLPTQGVPLIPIQEPGTTPAGKLIRQALLENRSNLDWDDQTDLFLAQRVLLYRQVIEPALARGENILGDRSPLSSLVFQGFAEQPTPAQQKTLLQRNRRIIRDHWPDLTIILDVSPQVGAARKARQAHTPIDHFETRGLEYDGRVRLGFFQESASAHTAYIRTDTRTADEVYTTIRHILTERLGLPPLA